LVGGERHEVRQFLDPMPEIRAQGGDDPHDTRACEAGEQLDEDAALGRLDAALGEDLLHLVDDQNQPCFLAAEDPAVLACRVGKPAECGRKEVAGICGGGAEMRGKLRCILPRAEQFRQADAVIPGIAARHRLRQAQDKVGAVFGRTDTARRMKAMPDTRCGFISRGTMAALTNDDLPDPLGPEIIRKATPPRIAFPARRSIAFVTSPSRPKKIGACSKS
jgi:hypothetical protein